MPLDLFSLSLLAMLAACLGAGMYLGLARGHRSERGVSTLAAGGATHQLGWLLWALATFNSHQWLSWLGVLCLLLGQLVLLAGTRRTFARPALLGWWGALVPLWLVALIMSLSGLILPHQAPLLHALLLAPLAFQISREAFHPGNDEHWSAPRWLLVGCMQGLSLTLALSALGTASGVLSLERAASIWAILACLISLILPYSYQLLVAHRLHARLSKLVRYDALTGLLNRRGLEEHAGRELHRARKHNGSMGLMLIDIDQFRVVNQRYGYGAGDVALKKCARELRKILGEDALIGRIAGEEFCVLLNDYNSQQLRTLAVEIEMSLQALAIEHGDHCFHLSVTLSLVKYGRHGYQFESLLQKAEEKLQYRKGNLRGENPAGSGAITITPAA
ncbi:GGDEF domain-containing protein [Chitinibacter sp. ZOR0017]|uniref:GGDEF domain-containing protein n=1 Tax=Chitinibacter sp. ZOR0017 TaxID=1339254 RepID=UPI00068C028C|nr:GGDEF domain-containing protein [Chitinibacter sp. ZOR0017]